MHIIQASNLLYSRCETNVSGLPDYDGPDSWPGQAAGRVVSSVLLSGPSFSTPCAAFSAPPSCCYRKRFDTSNVPASPSLVVCVCTCATVHVSRRVCFQCLDAIAPVRCSPLTVSLLLCGGYNKIRFDFASTAIRRPFDRLSKVIKVTVT